MNEDGSAINPDALGPLLSYFEENKLDGLLICGSTGEFPSLTFEEKLTMISEASSTKGKLKLIAGCGSTSLPEVLKLVEHAQQRGADAILLPPPWYFSPLTAETLTPWISAVLERTSLPVILYHIPGFTGIPITTDLLESLSSFENLWGIKDTGGKLQDTSRYIASKPGRVLLGSDVQLLSGLKIGAHGAISGYANIAPDLTAEIYRAFHAGGEAQALQNKLSDFKNGLRKFPNHATIKYLLSLRGINVGGVRLPLAPLSQADKEFIRTKSAELE